MNKFKSVVPFTSRVESEIGCASILFRSDVENADTSPRVKSPNDIGALSKEMSEVAESKFSVIIVVGIEELNVDLSVKVVIVALNAAPLDRVNSRAQKIALIFIWTPFFKRCSDS